MRFHQVMGSVAAFLFAALAFSVTLSFATFFQVPFSLTVVLAHTLVLGVPLFLIFWWKRWVNLITCICGGFVVAAASAVLPNVPRMRPKGSHESVGGVPRIIDGVPTAAAWQDFWQTLIFVGVFGAIAGAVFWAILLATDAVTPAGSQSGASGQAPSAKSATTFAVVAILLTGMLLAIGV